jgi:hypothetical protein
MDGQYEVSVSPQTRVPRVPIVAVRTLHGSRFGSHRESGLELRGAN